MEDKWQALIDHLKTDLAMSQVIHWCQFRDGSSCARRANVVRHLRQSGWSVTEVAEVLGLTRRTVFRLGTSASGTIAASAMPTKPVPPETIVKQSAQSSKGSTANKKDKT